MAPRLARTLSYSEAPELTREWTPSEGAPAEQRLLASLSSSTGSLALARRLLEEGADPNTALDDGTSALALAAHSGSLPMVRLLLNQGADPSWRDDRGDDVAEEALRGGNPSLANYLRNRKQWAASEREAAAAEARQLKQASVRARKQRYLERLDEQRRQARGAELVQQVNRSVEAERESAARAERVAGKWDRRARHETEVAARREQAREQERIRLEQRVAKTEGYHKGAEAYERALNAVAQARLGLGMGLRAMPERERGPWGRDGQKATTRERRSSKARSTR